MNYLSNSRGAVPIKPTVNRDAQLLTTIPGIGITLGMLISTEIDGIERFRSSSKLCSYADLVPSTYSSGGKTFHGKITSEDNR